MSPYSPDLNPIEQTFAKIEHWLRLAQKRSIADTWRYVGDLVATIQPNECTNYFVNAGYAFRQSMNRSKFKAEPPPAKGKLL